MTNKPLIRGRVEIKSLTLMRPGTEPGWQVHKRFNHKGSLYQVYRLTDMGDHLQIDATEVAAEKEKPDRRYSTRNQNKFQR